MACEGAAEMTEDLCDLVAEVEGGLVDGVAVGLGVGGGVATGGGKLGVDGGDGVVKGCIEGVEAGGGGGFDAREMSGKSVSEGEQARVLIGWRGGPAEEKSEDGEEGAGGEQEEGCEHSRSLRHRIHGVER